MAKCCHFGFFLSFNLKFLAGEGLLLEYFYYICTRFWPECSFFVTSRSWAEAETKAYVRERYLLCLSRFINNYY